VSTTKVRVGGPKERERAERGAGASVRMPGMRTLLTLLFLALVAVQARALTVREYKATMASADKSGITLTRIYVGGLGEGIVAANVQAERINKAPIFCQPQKLALGIDNFVNILDSIITTISTKAPREKVNEMSIVLLLLEGLQETFPCKGK